MSVTLVTQPDEFALTKGGRMLYTFLGDGRYQTTGVPATSVLFCAAPVAAGTTLTLTFNGNSYTLAFVNNPSLTNEFTPGSGDRAYVAALMAELQSYFPIREAYTLSMNDPSQLAGIIFTAKQPGPQFDISVTLPVGTPFAFGTTLFGADPILRIQYGVYCEVWLQKVGTSGNDLTTDYERIFTPTIECDADGLAQFDVGNVLHANLTADWPTWNLPAVTQAQYSNRKYFICYGEAFGSPIQVGRIQADQVRHAFLGGMDYTRRASGGVNLLFSQTPYAQDDTALRFGPSVRYVRPDEPQYLTFLNSRAAQNGCVLKIVRTFDNDTNDVRLNTLEAQDVPTGQKVTFAVGATQQDLLNNVPANRTLKEYTVQRLASDLTTPLSISYRYVINYDYQPYTRYFAYLNSFGCVDTLATFGKGSTELQRFYEQAERYVPALYEVADGEFVDYNISLQQSVEVATGFRSEADLRSWNDFYRSPYRFRLVDGKAMPIGITSKSIKQTKDGDTLFAHKFEYTYLFRDDFYSETMTGPTVLPPLGFVPGGGTVVVQPTIVQYAIDNTVPNAVRELTPLDIVSFRAAAARPNPSELGFLTESVAGTLFRGQNQPIPYSEVINTPTTRDQAGLTDVPVKFDMYYLNRIIPNLSSWTGSEIPAEL